MSISRTLLALAAAVAFAALAGCASTLRTVNESPRLQVATGDKPPATWSSRWKDVPLDQDVELDGPEQDESVWMRAAKRGAGAADWTLIGQVKPGAPLDAAPALGLPNALPIGVAQAPGSAIFGGAFGDAGAAADTNLKGFKARVHLKVKPPRITVGHNSATLPGIDTTVKVAVATPEITIGSSGSPAPSAPAPAGIRAGLEEDQRNSSDPQEVFCQTPMRAYNRETFPVAVTYKDSWSFAGPGCTQSGVRDVTVLLAPSGTQRQFCSIRTSPGSACREEHSATNVQAQRQ